MAVTDFARIMLLSLAGMAGLSLASAQDPADPQAAKDATIIQAMMRLPNIDVNANPKLKAVVARQLDRVRGTPRFLELVERFQWRESHPELLRLTAAQGGDNLGVGAASLLLKLSGEALLKEAVAGPDEEGAVKVIEAVGLSGVDSAAQVLAPVLDAPLSAARRNAAVAALGRQRLGEKLLVERVAAQKLPAELEFAAANALFDSADPQIRQQAAKHLKLPETADAKPLPPVTELAKRRGSAEHGRELFLNKATCVKCHKVSSEGKNVGPDLSEIGGKLSREALLVSILNPSAAISHNYESYSLILDSGNVATGVLVSETDDVVILRTAEAIEKRFNRAEIDEMAKLKTSLMPADLQKLLSIDELVDVVEFLTTLKKN